MIYFEILFLRAQIYIQGIFPFIIRKWPSFFRVTLLIFKSSLSNINEVILAASCFICTMYNFHPFNKTLYWNLPKYLACLCIYSAFHKHDKVVSCFLSSLIIYALSCCPFTFNVFITMIIISLPWYYFITVVYFQLRVALSISSYLVYWTFLL